MLIDNWRLASICTIFLNLFLLHTNQYLYQIRNRICIRLLIIEEEQNRKTLEFFRKYYEHAEKRQFEKLANMEICHKLTNLRLLVPVYKWAENKVSVPVLLLLLGMMACCHFFLKGFCICVVFCLNISMFTFTRTGGQLGPPIPNIACTLKANLLMIFPKKINIHSIFNIINTKTRLKIRPKLHYLASDLSTEVFIRKCTGSRE